MIIGIAPIAGTINQLTATIRKPSLSLRFDFECLIHLNCSVPTIKQGIKTKAKALALASSPYMRAVKSGNSIAMPIIFRTCPCVLNIVRK